MKNVTMLINSLLYNSVYVFMFHLFRVYISVIGGLSGSLGRPVLVLLVRGSSPGPVCCLSRRLKCRLRNSPNNCR